jgi:beta-glucosidase-like glycosyl hydrolase
LTVEELVGMMQADAPAVERLGLPNYHYGYEAIHGVMGGCPFKDRCFTSFPCSSASAASFNRSLWHKTGSAQIDEIRGMYNSQAKPQTGAPISGLHVRGPQLNPQRDPRWGRNDNSPGEDAYLEGQYGAWMVLGGQGADHTGQYLLGERRKAICEMKHFDAYSVEDGRNTISNNYNISLRDLVDYYFVPLKACIDVADVGAFMCSYNAINGTATCGDRWLNVDVVRKSWNFSGVIESDCGAVSGIQAHGNTDSQEGAAVLAVEATLDVECDSVYKNNLVTAESKGEVKRAALEAAAARVLKGRFQLGQFDPRAPEAPWDSLGTDAVFSAAHQQVALEGAQQSAVLLRNPPPSLSRAAHLPLKRGMKIAVIGPNGNVADVSQGQYHGGNCPDAHPPAPYNPTYDYDCLPTAFSEILHANVGGETTYHGGCSLSPSADDGSGHPEGQPCESLVNMSEVLDAAKSADVVLLFLGLDIKMTNKEGQDRNHDWTGYALPGMQQELARQIALLDKPTTVVVLSGMAVGMDYIAQQSSWPLLIGGYGGRFGPVALSQILFGEVSPTGRLPYTVYPEAWANNTAMTDMSLTAGDGRTYTWYKAPTPAPFLFGQGLTYTNFSVAVSAESQADYTVTVINTGSVAAAQTVMLFAHPVSVPEGPLPLPNRQLFDFGRTHTLAPGASEVLRFTVGNEAVALVDWAGTRKAFAGKYEIEFFTGDRTAAAVQPFMVQSTVFLSTLPPPRSLETVFV